MYLIYLSPSFFGFEEINEHIYVESGDDFSKREEVNLIIRNSFGKTKSFYENEFSYPTFFVCVTAKCDHGVSRLQGEKAKSYGTWIVQVSSRGIDQRAITHELSHIALHKLVGFSALGAGRLPSWYDEGLAVIVSEDDRYIKIDEGGNFSCLVDESSDLPITGSAWNEVVKKRKGLYAAAACRVVHWMERNGGRRGVMQSLRDIHDGGNLPP